MSQFELFTEAPVKLRMPLEPIVRTATIAGECRFDLKRAWGAGPCIAWVGLNPSTADAALDDPTIRREIGFSWQWGYGSLIKLNIYPFITPSPTKMRAWLARRNDDFDVHDAIANNFMVCSELLRACDMRIAAWGLGADLDDVTYLVDVYEEWQSPDIEPLKWHCLGTNADGSPRHTLSRGKNRIPDSAKPILWAMKETLP